MKKIDLTSIVFLAWIIGCFTLTVTAFFDRTEISQKENRTLQSMPQLRFDTYLNGSFFKDLESYFYDHFPQREQILRLVAVYDRVKGIQPEIMALEKGNNMNLVNTGSDVPATDQGKSEESNFGGDNKPANKNEDASESTFSDFKTQTQNLDIMAVKDKLLELYHFQEDKINAYVTAVNQFAEKMPKQVRMHVMLIPTQIGLTGEEYLDYSDPQEKAIEYTYSLLDKRYERVEVFQTLLEKKEEYLYFRSDHHWTQLGAYYAARVFTRQAGVEFQALEEYEKHSFEGFLGYLYHNNQVEKVAQSPDRIDAYVSRRQLPELNNYYYLESGELDVYRQPLIQLNSEGGAANYGIFLGGDFPIIVYENPEGKSGRSLIIVKDSYANAFVPWLAESFDKIIVIDPRFYKDNIYQLAVEEEITDFMVLDYIMATGLDGFIQMLDKISGV